eukprot:m.824808 g.824808  ORF g.824808 m.824808 type:complete len:235 (+) comp23406_c0_seq21:151-855(+)
MSSPCGFVEWLEFFLGAGIPDSHAKSYAEVFESNRMDFDMLGDLDRDVLSAMGITVMGDVLAIKKHAGQVIAQGGIAKSVSSGGIRSNSAGGSAGAAKSLVRDALDAKASAARAAHRKRKAVKHSSGNKSGIFSRIKHHSQEDFGAGDVDSAGESIDNNSNANSTESRRRFQGSAKFYIDDMGVRRPVRQVPREQEGNYTVIMPYVRKTCWGFLYFKFRLLCCSERLFDKSVVE